MIAGATPLCCTRAYPYSQRSLINLDSAACAPRLWRSGNAASIRDRAHPGADAFGRQPHSGDGTLTGRADEFEGAAVQLCHGLGEWQAEARALIFAREAAVDLAEGAQRGLEVFGRDADAGIADRDPEAPLLDRGLDGDASTRLREFDGVREQVDQDLLQATAVGAERRKE